MKIKTILKVAAAAIVLGGSGTSGSAPAVIDERSMVDLFVMRDDVRFSETDESGRMAWEVRGKRAESLNASVVRMHYVTATFVQDNGDEIRVYTDACDINKDTLVIETDLRVDIFQGDNILSGVGMKINHKAKRFQLFKDVQMLTHRSSGLSMDSFK